MSSTQAFPKKRSFLMNRRTSLILVFVLSLTPLAAMAQTVTRFLSINPLGTDISGSLDSANAYYRLGFLDGRSLTGIVMPDPDTGLSRFQFGFTIPDDYAPGTDMYLRVLWRSEAISCVVDLRHNTLTRVAPGQQAVNGNLSKDGEIMLAPNNHRISSVIRFRLAGLETHNFAPGDAILGGLYRHTALDSCSDDLFIHGLSIEYQALTSAVFKNGFEDLS